MKTLELKDIAAYLPYRLTYLRPDGHTVLQARGILGTLLQAEENGQITYSSLCGSKPFLRPISDLTKEIMHRGEKFVPIVEIGKLFGHRNLERYEHDGQVEYGWEVRYADDSQGYSFGWHDKTKSFGVWMDEIDQCAPYESNTMNCDIFDKLAEWMFDYRGLIPAGLAIDVNTLDKNPYEV